MVQLANPFSLLAEKHVKDGDAEENAAKASFLAAKKNEKDEKKKQNHRPRRRPGSSTSSSLKPSNGSQNDSKGNDSVSVSSSTSLNDVVDQTRGSNKEEATTEVDLDAKGWQLVQYQKKKGTRNGNHGQTQATQGAILNNQVNVKEEIKQLQEVAKGMIGSQGVKPKKPNMNGSVRRRLQKNKAGAGQDQQVQANKETTPPASPNATEIAHAEKLTVTYTLEEYEMMMKNGNINKSDEQHHQFAEKDKSYKGRRKQRSGHKLNGDIEDVSPAIVEKAVDTSFAMNPGEFPILGKQGRA